jgi:hypothetical protein
MKRFVSLAFPIFLVHFVFGQSNLVEFGLKGGVNIASFKIEPEFNSDSRVGFHLGMLTHIHLSDHFAAQPELMISSQGADYGNDGKDKFSYVNIPILVQYMFGPGFRVETGPQIGFLASAKSEQNDDDDIDIKDNFKTVDFSWAFGAGYLGNSGLGLDVRYNLGINDIEKGADETSNRVWQVGLFYQFRKGRVSRKS